jgi:hypothetical protein
VALYSSDKEESKYEQHKQKYILKTFRMRLAPLVYLLRLACEGGFRERSSFYRRKFREFSSVRCVGYQAQSIHCTFARRCGESITIDFVYLLAWLSFRFFFFRPKVTRLAYSYSEIDEVMEYRHGDLLVRRLWHCSSW